MLDIVAAYLVPYLPVTPTSADDISTHLQAPEGLQRSRTLRPLRHLVDCVEDV